MSSLTFRVRVMLP